MALLSLLPVVLGKDQYGSFSHYVVAGLLCMQLGIAPPSDPDIEQDIETALENLPAQTPAAYRFRWQDERIKADPPDPSPGDSAVAQDLLDETRRKADALSERLQGSNADPHVARSVNGLLDVLPAAVGDLRPGLFLSRTRSIEADAAAYGEPDAERELFPGAVAQILDLSETARDLQGCFPEIRNIEGERLALNINPDDVDAVQRHVESIVEKALAEGTVVDDSAKEALRTITAGADQDDASQDKQRLVGDRVLVVRNFLSPLFRLEIASKLASEITDVTRETWEKARPKFIDGLADGIGSTGRHLGIVGVSTLVGAILGPTAGLTMMAAGFGRIGKLINLLQKRLQKDQPDADPDDGKADKPSRDPDTE